MWTEESQELALATRELATAESQDAFLALYVKHGTIQRASDGSGANRESVRRWSQDDVLGFSSRFQAAKEAFRESLEELALARLRAPEGNRGSDILLMGMLNANYPDKWSRNLKLTHDVPNELLQSLRALQELGTKQLPEPKTVEGKVLPWE